jgi:UDP-N-acetylmuramate dehydrogenase
MSIVDKFKLNIALAPLTTFKIGGVARYFLEVEQASDLIEAITWAKENKENFFILGGGSNILISDQGFSGLVIKLNLRNLSLENNIIEAGSGLLLSQAVLLSIDQAKTGLEWAVGLPGTVGGAVWGNAGCYGSDMQEIVDWVEYFDCEDLKLKRLTKLDCQFAYRHSIFSEKQWVIVQVALKVADGVEKEIRSRVTEIIQFGATRQIKLPTPGCVFKNLSFAELQEQNADIYAEAVRQNKIRDGKIAAGWLIERLDLKGKSIGGAQISEQHANFIVNKTGQATASEVMMLISYVKQQARDKYGVILHDELQLVGF